MGFLTFFENENSNTVADKSLDRSAKDISDYLTKLSKIDMNSLSLGESFQLYMATAKFVEKIKPILDKY